MAKSTESTVKERKQPFFKDTVTGEIFQSGGNCKKNTATGNPAIRVNPDGSEYVKADKPATTRKAKESAPSSTPENGLLMLNRAGISAVGELAYNPEKGAIETTVKITDPKLAKFKFTFEKPAKFEPNMIQILTIGENQTLVTLSLESLKGLIK